MPKSFTELEVAKQVKVRAPKVGQRTEILVYGHRDPRGPDNNVNVWVDEDGKFHIKVWKTDRCYRFEEMIDEEGSVEIVAIPNTGTPIKREQSEIRKYYVASLATYVVVSAYNATHAMRLGKRHPLLAGKEIMTVRVATPDEVKFAARWTPLSLNSPKITRPDSC